MHLILKENWENLILDSVQAHVQVYKFSKSQSLYFVGCLKQSHYPNLQGKLETVFLIGNFAIISLDIGINIYTCSCFHQKSFVGTTTIIIFRLWTLEIAPTCKHYKRQQAHEGA